LTADRQRIDKWLWHARVVRTRSAAAALAQAGHVRVNGQRIDAASRPVRPGDVVTVALDRRVRVIKVIGFAERRSSSENARSLYEDLAPPPAPGGSQSAPAERLPGAGRPTKQDRRAIDRLHQRDGD
jgi:ribosome-associated heat shock protein Hsp15